MHLKDRVMAVLLTVILTGFTFWGSTQEIREIEIAEDDGGFHSDKETIYFWYSDESLTNYINNAAVSFGEQEDARVIPILTSKNDFLETINSASLSDEQKTPDAYIINNDSLEKAYLAGLAVPVKDEGLLNINQFPRTALSAVTYEEQFVAYPMYFETSTLLYNKTYLDMAVSQIFAPQQEEPVDTPEENEGAEEEESVSHEEGSEDQEELAWSELITEEGIPLTMDGLLQLSNSFDAPEQVEVIFEWNVSDIFFNYWFVGSSMVIGTDSGDDHSEIHILNEDTITNLTTYQNLNQFFSIQSDKITTEDCIRDFMEGKIMFTLATSDQIAKLKAAKEEGSLQFEYGFANLPILTEENSGRAMSVTNTIAINGYSPHKELANRFARYLVDEYCDELYDKTGKIPTASKVIHEDSNVEVFYEEYKRSISLPKMMEIGNLWLQLEALFSKVWNGAEIEPLVAELDEQIRTQLDSRP